MTASWKRIQAVNGWLVCQNRLNGLVWVQRGSHHIASFNSWNEAVAWCKENTP